MVADLGGRQHRDLGPAGHPQFWFAMMMHRKADRRDYIRMEFRRFLHGTILIPQNSTIYIPCQRTWHLRPGLVERAIGRRPRHCVVPGHSPARGSLRPRSEAAGVPVRCQETWPSPPVGKTGLGVICTVFRYTSGFVTVR